MTGKIMDKKWLMYILVAVCALLWGFSFFGTTVALQKIEPMQLLAMRWTIAAVIFLILAALGVVKLKLKGKNWKALLVVGLLQPSFYSIFETNGINLTTTSESSIFIATIPLMVLIIGGLFLHKKYSWKVAVAIVMAFAGVIICVVFSPNFSLGGKGVGYMVLMGAVLMGALYCYASNGASSDFGSLEMTFGMAIIGAIFFNCISFAMGYGFEGYKICLGDGKMFMAVLFLGICCSCLCYMIFNLVLGALPTAIASNLIGNSTTAIGVLTGVIFAGDPFGWYTIVGLILTLSGIILSSLETEK